MQQTIPAAADAITFRPLKWNETARRGDFVEDGNQGFEPWIGPSGFQAGTFNKQIFRKLTRPAAKPTPVA
jgi:hypothetical protein